MTLAQGHLHIKIKLAFLSNRWANFQPNFACKLIGTRKHNAGHMTKMAPLLIYGKTLKNLFSRNHLFSARSNFVT